MRKTISEWIANKLPRQVIYYTLIRAYVHATSGKWKNQLIDSLTPITVLQRWHKKNSGETIKLNVPEIYPKRTISMELSKKGALQLTDFFLTVKDRGISKGKSHKGNS